jgi:NDP-sugar pyrophosphorylase family protein
MQIIVPMSGFGERFRRAGYEVPKPLIPVDGKPIIGHVIDLFPGETNFLFICNQDHLDNPAFRMRQILSEYCPTGRIFGIPPHKLGPVFAVSQIFEAVDDGSPVIVNYCDFTAYWDWADFRSFVDQTQCDGCIPSYRNFHPHMLHSTSFAYTRNEGLWVRAIQEKQPYTDYPMEEFASSGTYYFSSGDRMKRCFRETMERKLALNGEYYVSLAYVPLIEAGAAIAVYELQHFMQWGTPEDLAQYQRWSALFRRLASDTQPQSQFPRVGSVVLPMAGAGQRFADQGYSLPKPLIPVSGRPMVVQAARDLPAANQYAFVLRQDLPQLDAIQSSLRTHFPRCAQVMLEQLTDGQARTALFGLDAVDESAPVTIGACDNGMLYDRAAFQLLQEDPNVDVIVWGMTGHPGAVQNPRMYGWIDAENGLVRQVSVKTPLANPATDPAVVGTFSFRRGRDFRAAAERMIARNARVNGEFYIDTCINDAIALGLRCRLFLLDHYIGWGTPDDLKTFEYWQSCFHKWHGHPYRLESDPRVDPAALPALDARYAPVTPARPTRTRS